MNRLLEHYCVDVRHPHVSGVEHLEMLQIRDKLARIEGRLSDDERKALAQADRRLLEQADAFYAELSRFVDLAERRRERQVQPSHWWWYLDVLVQLPRQGFLHAPAKETALASAE